MTNQPSAPLNRERRIDWARILVNLQATGLSLQQIADDIDCGRTTLLGYMNEDAPSEPQYWVGHSLLALWCVKCGTNLADVPIKRVQLSVSAMLKAMA